MAAPSGPLIFVSYRSGSMGVINAPGIANWLLSLGARLGSEFTVSADAIHPDGALTEAEATDQIKRASVFIALIDHKWVYYHDKWGRRLIDDEQDVVRRQLEMALELGIPIIPVLCPPAELPPADALPSSIARLSQLPPVTFKSSLYGAELDDLVRAIHGVLDLEEMPGDGSSSEEAFQVLDVEVRGFRGFRTLQVDLAAESSLEGQWTCVAGINGAGKSTILQALALLMLGPELARELGGKRIASMRRRDLDGYQTDDTYLRARVRHRGREYQLEMTIGEEGPRSRDMSFWSRSSDVLVAGYGASRNLSEARGRDEKHSPKVGACVSLFDPMARLQGAESILQDASVSEEHRERTRTLLYQLIGQLFGGELAATTAKNGEPLFSTGGAALSAQDLPDGFRSSVTWLADLCDRWVAMAPPSSNIDAGNITGLVLIDEIDLHLHASLQRSIIPRLRRALPRVQFVASSHSPLILSSFDRHELILLDETEEDGIRHIDRQVLGFTPDEIYEWLLGVPSSSEAVEGILERAGSSKDLGARGKLRSILGVSPAVDDKEAQERMERIKARMEKFKQ